VQLLDDYAFLLEGVLHLYEATLKPAHLEFAMNLADRMLARFYDPTHGGFWQAPADSPHLILRIKEDYDGAEPSGNSVAALSLLRLAAITARNGYRQAAIKTLALFQDRLQNTPRHFRACCKRWTSPCRNRIGWLFAEIRTRKRHVRCYRRPIPSTNPTR
jgi:hypothetical protein